MNTTQQRIAAAKDLRQTATDCLEVERGCLPAYRRAQTRLIDAKYALCPYGEVLSDDPELQLQYAITIDAMGQIFHAMGSIGEARSALREAATFFNGTTPYELNNLIERLKVEMLPKRLALMPRGLWLARGTPRIRRVLGLSLSRWVTLRVIA